MSEVDEGRDGLHRAVRVGGRRADGEGRPPFDSRAAVSHEPRAPAHLDSASCRTAASFGVSFGLSAVAVASSMFRAVSRTDDGLSRKSSAASVSADTESSGAAAPVGSPAKLFAEAPVPGVSDSSTSMSSSLASSG